MAEARVLYGRGLCTDGRGSYWLAVRKARFCMAEVCFCVAEAHGVQGVPHRPLHVAVGWVCIHQFN